MRYCSQYVGIALNMICYNCSEFASIFVPNCIQPCALYRLRAVLSAPPDQAEYSLVKRKLYNSKPQDNNITVDEQHSSGRNAMLGSVNLPSMCARPQRVCKAMQQGLKRGPN